MNKKCVVCGSFDTLHLFRTHDRHYGIAGEFDLVRCAHCSLVHLDPMPTEKQLASYYPDNYYAYQPGKVIIWWKQLLAKLLCVRIKTHDPKFQQAGDFLDIGCGSGEYLHVMAKRGWTVSGVEPSCKGALAGKNAGLNIFNGTLYEAKFPSESFDYVRSNHSFEHIPNPEEVISEIHKILRPEGKVFIGIPNIDSLPFRIFGRYWWYLGAPVHTYNYSVKTISLLLEHAGFRVVHIFFNSNYASLLGSLQIYMNRNTGKRSDDGFLIRNPLLKITANLIEKCIDRAHRGDAIEIICEKLR